MSTNNLLEDGWKTNDTLWLLIEPSVKSSIAEFISALHLCESSQKKPAEINLWLKDTLEKFFDKRYNTVVPRHGRVDSSNRAFWENLNAFGLVATRLISHGYTTEQGTNFVLKMIEAVKKAESCRVELYQDY